MEHTQAQLGKDLQELRIDRQRVAHRRLRGRGWLLALGIIVAGFVALAFVAKRIDVASRLSPQPTPAQPAVAPRQSLNNSQPVLTAAGYIIARHEAEVASKITGRVTSLVVKEGDFVSRDQIIARLDDSEQSAQVRQEQANVAAAKARLAEVERGARPQELQREKRLSEEGIVSKQSLDDASARYQMALNDYQAAKEDYELVRIGPRQEEIELVRSQSRQAEAALTLAQAQLENTIIRAPVSGTILHVYVNLGEMVTTGFTSERGARQALVSIADLSDLQIELDITEADFGKVQLNQPAEIISDAYPDHQYKGVVEYIASVADRQKASIQVKVKVLNPDSILRPDMTARVVFYPLDEKAANAARP
jgi:HlyD family secretion protein